MSSKTDKYAILSGKQGLPASEMYKYKPRETTSTYSDFTSNTPSRFSLRSFDITPTVDVENTRKAFDGLYDNILSLYSQNGAGQAISGDYRYLTDSLIANALGKDYTDVAKNHSYYVRAITGENMDDKSFAEAFGDAWTSYYTNRSIAWKQLMFDWSNDEEEKANLLGDIADLEDVLVKKGDYSNRGFVAKNLVASAPVMNQIIEAVGITLAGNVIGSSVAGVGASVSMGNALKNVATASKLAKVGTGLGIATNVANTFTVETGSLSRELYNMTDENGNRISDTQRKVASMLGGAVVTALEYATPDPFFGFTKLGKGLPKSVAKQSFGKWLATAGLNRIKDASSESFEEGLQSVASYIAKDIAKWYGNNSGDTNFNLDSAEQSLYNAIVEGVDSFKDTFTPMLVASFLPGTARDLTTLRRSIKNSRDAKMHEKNSPTARRESGKWQAESADPNVISMDLINLKAGGYDTDYSLDIDENGKAKKLGKVNVIQDPNNPDMFIGATEKDDDILKWAYDKKFKAVDVNVLEYGSAVMDEESIGNIARAFGGDFKDGIATVDSMESLDAMEKTLEDAGLSVNTGDGSFTFTNEETGKETTVRIATQDERDVASAMSKSEGVISNRDFVKEIKNALTADGQIETQVTDDEIALVSSLAGMLGNDVTSKMEFVSAYSDNVSLDEAEAVGGAKGATVFSSDATKSARIILSDNSDASTVAHEMFHVALRYNESARGKLVDAVSKTVSNKNSRRGLRQFLSEHTKELKRANIQSVDDAMRILDGITRDNVLSTVENQEVLTSMFEMYNNSGSKAKERMPSSLKSFFKALYDTFRKIYKNVTGKSLMPEGLASAYSSFVEDSNAQTNNSSSVETNNGILRQQEIENEEYREVERKYKGTDQWMKAPNGKPTNLTERQWVQVRTPSFIKWFGDWINNPDNASKVVDENGEPLVMYHGTRASFDVFDTSYEGEDRKEYESAWMADYPDGTMFAISDKKKASYYGSKVMPLFLNIREKEMKASSFAEAINFMDNGDASFSDTVIKVYKDNDWRDDPREFEGAIVAFHNSNDAKSATDNIGTFSTANDSILYQSSSPEENVAREFSSDRNASQRYTFAYFTEKDVSDMIDAGIYVPPMLLDKYPENEAVIREKSDRLMMENFLVDNEVRKALVASKNVEQFLESMRQYYDTAYNANTEAILRKIYAYDKMQTPSQMRAWFKSEYATGNIDKLMELKAMVGLRRSTKISKNGKVYTTVSVPDSSFAYNKLMNLDRTSSKEAVKEVTDSIQRNPNPWIRDYIKASQMDYAKKFEGSEVGGYDYLKAKSDLMYLSLGSTEFNLINEIREASKVNDFTPDEIKEQESIKESRKALEREARELQKELKMEGSEPSGTTPLEMSKLFYEDEISAITDRSNEEIAKLKEKMDINSLVSSMREDELKAKYKKKIEKLEAEKNERIAKLNETLKDVRTKRDEQYKELRDKKNQKIDEIREDRNRKLRELSSYYNARISNIKLRRDTTIAKIKLVNRFKKDLKVDHSVYSADIDEVYKWMYCLIRNKQKMGTIDYERYAMKKGETTDSDVLIFSFEPSDYRMSIDEENTSGLELNEVDDANSPSLEYEFNPNAYNFDRTDVPLSLMEFGFSPEALREITDPERRFDSFSYDTLVELYEAFSTAKRISKATKSAMDSAKRQKRAELAGKMYGTIARTEAGIPADALHAVLRSIGATEEEYRHDPDVRAKAMSEFTKGISRYSDILQHKLTARDRFFSFASNSIGHIQWVADFLESNKNGAFHKLFVDRAQTALNNYEAMRRKRTREAMDAIKSAAGGDEMWAKIHKELTSKDASIDVTYNQNGTKLDEYSYRSGKITLNQALGIYIYAKNYQSLGNLLSGKGNNFSLETLARINPEAMKRFLGEEMAMRDEFVPETKFFTDSRGNIIPYKTRFTDSLFKNNTKAEIYDVYGRLVNGEFDNGMPSWFSKIGDAIVETLSGKDNEYTNRLAKFSAEVLNNPFTFQESYFPKVSDGRVKVSAIGEVSGAKSKHVSTGAVKDRQTAFNYPLRLDPINVMLGAIEAQERMVNMYETVSDMNYLMSDKGSNFGAIISARYGDGMRKFIESQIADLAGNKPILSDYEKLGNVFLQNVSTSKIALNFMTALKQFLSVFPATFNGELKMHDLLNGVALASGNNKTTADALYRKYATDVADSSLGYEYTMMKRRMEATGLNTMRTKLLDFSMGFTNWSDQKVKKWVFMGAFDKYLKQGMSESDAGLRATEIVKKTQSIGDSYSLSNFERNRSPFVRAFAMFSKDMFNIWNSIVFGAFGADVNNKDFFQIGERMLGIGILSLASALVAGGFIPDDDDDGAFDEDAFFEDLYSNLIGYVPFFGTFFSNDGSDSLLTEPVMKIKDMFDTVGSATMKISEGEGIEEEANKFINAGLDALGAVGVPSVAVKRAIKMFAPDGLISDDYAFNPGWLFGKTGASTFNLVF